MENTISSKWVNLFYDIAEVGTSKAYEKVKWGILAWVRSFLHQNVCFVESEDEKGNEERQADCLKNFNFWIQFFCKVTIRGFFLVDLEMCTFRSYYLGKGTKGKGIGIL